MLYQRESTCDGKAIKQLPDRIAVFFGFIGALIVLYSSGFESPQIGYISGSFFLLLTAFYFRLVYFIALEMILISGHTVILLGIGPYLQFAVPCLLSFQLLVYYILTRQLNNIFLITGVVGIALLSIGFALQNSLVFFFGSATVAIYAYYEGYKGMLPSYLWGTLNLIFALISLFRLME